MIEIKPTSDVTIDDLPKQTGNSAVPYVYDDATQDAEEILRNTGLVSNLEKSVQQQQLNTGISFKDVFGHDPA